VKRHSILLLIACSLVSQARAGLLEGHEAFAVGDFDRAYAEFLPLAGMNNWIGAYYLGVMHMEGLGVAANAENGARWLRRAADSGHAGAQLRLATAYENGEGVAQDYRAAARWMLEAARGGNADAQYYLGQYYRDGRGIVQDDAQAYEWIHRSVEYDISHERLLDAFLFLGAAWEWGRGLRQDLVEAYKWFSLAASYSPNDARLHDEASRALGALRIRMNVAELEEAGRRAYVWQQESIRCTGPN
jgi:hypothetical protein